MALRARKVSGAFQKRAAGPTKFAWRHFGEYILVVEVFVKTARVAQEAEQQTKPLH